MTCCLLGVHNIDHHAHKTAQQHKQEEAVTRIQAAYRGHQVRKSLHWGTHQPTAATRYKKSTKKRLQEKAKPVEEVSVESIHLEPSLSSVQDTGNLRDTGHDRNHDAGHNTSRDTGHNTSRDTGHDRNRDAGSVPVPPWEQAGGDMMSVINIYTRQYEKLQEQFNATAGTCCIY